MSDPTPDRIPADDLGGPIRCESAMTDDELLDAARRLGIQWPHLWEFGTFAGGWSMSSCARCGRVAFGSTRKWDILARLWPSRFACGKADR